MRKILWFTEGLKRQCLSLWQSCMYLWGNISLTGNIKIEMTKGVTTKHILEKKDKYGEIELQEMCFYLENKFQVRMVIKVLRNETKYSGDLRLQWSSASAHRPKGLYRHVPSIFITSQQIWSSSSNKIKTLIQGVHPQEGWAHRVRQAVWRVRKYHLKTERQFANKEKAKLFRTYNTSGGRSPPTLGWRSATTLRTLIWSTQGWRASTTLDPKVTHGHKNYWFFYFFTLNLFCGLILHFSLHLIFPTGSLKAREWTRFGLRLWAPKCWSWNQGQSLYYTVLSTYC